MTVQATFAATLVDEWVRAGVTDAVVAPGSRSTPMALALAASPMRTHVHLDERSAGFFGLGLGLASGRPAVVLTTSGTATAELLPAVVEAHYARVPLIVCTADRPPELHDVGAPQTIAQHDLYGGGLLRWRCDPGPPEALPVASWRSLGARLVAAALAGPGGPGPVHCNLAFRDPLVGARGPLPPGRHGGHPWHRTEPGVAAPAAVDVDLFSGRRGIIVAGAGLGQPAPVLALAERLGWPVLADPLGGCRGCGSPVAVAAFDPLLRVERWAAAHRPEVVLRLGSPPASKVLAGWLASAETGAAAAMQVVADPWGAWPDPARTAGLVVGAGGDVFCAALLAASPGPAPSGWGGAWAAAESAAQDAISRTLAAYGQVTEPGLARAVTAALGDEATLVVSSSMPIRDVEWFGYPQSAARVLANRGANGIDGFVSTALGVAAASAGPAVALLGDLAFLHDGGGLLWAGRRGVQLTFVVVDNDGGGIFSFLPQAAALPAVEFERLLGTPHGLDLTALAGVHGLPVTEVAAAADMAPAVSGAVAAGGVQVVLVRTDRRANVAVHDELNAAVAASL